MSSAVVAAQIARLDAIGRDRALTDGESRQLQRFIAMESRYASMRNARAAAPVRSAGPRLVASDGIVVRLEATLTLIARDGCRVRAIYLTELDRADLKATGKIKVGNVLNRGRAEEGPTFRGHAVRLSTGKADSKIYDTNGCARSVLKRVP